jgi:hypothetical protein
LLGGRVVLNLRLLLPAAHNKPYEASNHQQRACYHEPMRQLQPFHGGLDCIHLFLCLEPDLDQAAVAQIILHAPPLRPFP